MIRFSAIYSFRRCLLSSRIIYPLKCCLSVSSKQPLDIFSINFDRFKDTEEVDGNDVKPSAHKDVVFPCNKENLFCEGGVAIKDNETLSFAVRHFNPALISALKTVNFSSKNKNLDEVLKETKLCLELISTTRLSSSLWRRMIFNKANANNSSKYFLILRDFRTLSSDLEFMAFVACIRILLPQDMTLWMALDERLVAELSRFSMNTCLFFAYCISSSNEMLRKHVQFQTPEAVLNRILQRRKEEKKGFEILINHSCNSQSFAEIGASGVSDSYAIEQLGLLLHLFANNPINSAERGPILADLSDHSFRALLSIQSPVKLATFRMLWCNAPLLNFQESYIFYKSLYQQILYSLNASPFHAIQQLDDVIGLLSSMVAIKVKDSLLISRLCNILQERRIHSKDRDKSYSIRIFKLLVQLDFLPAALTFIQQLLQGDQGSVTQDSAWLLHSPLSLSWEAQKVLFNILNERPKSEEFTCAELILLILCNNPTLTKNHGNFRQLLQKVEDDIVPKISQLPQGEVCNLLQAYAIGTRLYPPMMREIEMCLPLWPVSGLTSEQILKILWSLAKLNHIKGDYIDTYIDRFLQSLELLATSMHALEKIVHGLWSMAVMDKLQLEHAKLVLPHLEKYVASRGMQLLPEKLVNQFQQVLLDIKLKAQRAEEESFDLSKFATVGRARDPNWREKDKSLSSYSHKDVSKMLNEMGISHFNEKRLTYFMLVDIYIPIANIPETLLGKWSKEENTDTLGLVIEYDGPTHFDSFCTRRPLGTTVMKRRHIIDMGYDLIALPFWEYDHTLASEEKKNFLASIIYEHFNSSDE